MKLLELFSPVVKTIVAAVATLLLNKVVEAVPDRAHYILNTIYMVIDVEIETITDASETSLDDAVVEALMEVLERIAAENCFELTNADND